jgi:hypothetical protein
MLVLCATARADEREEGERWAESLSRRAIVERLPDDGGPVIVAPMGVDTTQAADALVRALEQARHPALSAPPSLVYIDASDDALAASLFAWGDSVLPVPRARETLRVAILRCPPVSSLHAPVAVVTFRDRKAGVVASIVAERGRPPLHIAVPKPGAVTPDDAPAPDAVPPPANTRVAAGHAEYQRRALDLGHPLTHHIALLEVHRRNSETILHGADVYRALDRDDLARRYSRRRTAEISLSVVGALTLVAGLVVGAEAGLHPHWYSFGCGGRDARGDCTQYTLDDYHDWFTAGALVGVLGGSTLVIVASMLSPHPVDLEEFLRLFRDRDRALRRRYGVPDEERSQRREAPLRIGLVPAISRTGGGLALTLELP